MIRPHSLPHFNVFFARLAIKHSTRILVVRFVLLFLLNYRRASAAAASQTLPCDPRHKTSLLRFLQRQGWSRDWILLKQTVDWLLQEQQQQLADGCRDPWVLILDATKISHQSQTLENTFSTGTRPRQGKPSTRKQKSYHHRRCHCFIFALLITPSGMRLPLCRSYYVPDYARQRGRVPATESDLGAELIRDFPWPSHGPRLVLGDTAYESKAVRKACRKVGANWIVPINPERRFAGKDGERARVRSRVAELTASMFSATRFSPAQGSLANYRRPSLSQQKNRKCQHTEYYTVTENHDVHNVGPVRLVFSRKHKPLENERCEAKTLKILMTNARHWSCQQIVEYYSLRWQIELFFKELKDQLGMADYRMREFVAVENWVQLCVLSFCYLEYYRDQKLKQTSLTDKDRKWWQSQRCCGLTWQVRQESELADWAWVFNRCHTEGGRRKVRQQLRTMIPEDFQEPSRKRPRSKRKPKKVA